MGEVAEPEADEAGAEETGEGAAEFRKEARDTVTLTSKPIAAQ